MEDDVGFGFRPNDEELVGHFLRNKIEGNTSHVQEYISEVNICSYDPWELRFQSKYKSRDPMWYFFSRRENKYGNGNRQSRTTKSGKWKLTGEPANVTDQWGFCSGVRGKIGYKRVLVFLDGRYPEKTKSDWVIHEFHYDRLPEHKRTHVICRLEYKGDDQNILSAYAIDPTPASVANMTNSEGSVVNQSCQGNTGSYNTYSSDMQQSVQENSGYLNHFPDYDLANHDQWLIDYSNLQQQVPYSAPYENESEIWKQLIEENVDSLVDERRTSMQENYSDYRPKKPVTGILADDSSDSETGSMIFGDTSSSTDSVKSSNDSYHTIDDIPSLNTVENLHNYEAQEQPKQLKLQCQSKEKVINMHKSECEWKMAEDSIRKPPSTNIVKQSWIVLEKRSQRNTQWNYLKNMIIGVLLFISIIGWIILVG